MKMYDKYALEYINGYLVTHDGDVVNIDNEIVDLANKIETDLQRARYINDQPEQVPGDYACENFNRKSEHDIPMKFVAETPILDKKIEEAIDMMDEIDTLNHIEEFKMYIAGIDPLVKFVRDGFIVETAQEYRLHKFDLPTLGNPLEWDLEMLFHTVEEILNGKQE